MCPPGNQPDDHIGEKADGDTGRDRECERHDHGHQHHRNNGGEIVPVNSGERREEPGRHKDKGRCRRKAGDRSEQRLEEQAQQEQRRHGQRGQSGAPAGTDAGSAFKIGRHAGGAEQAADDRGAGVRHDGAVQILDAAVGAALAGDVGDAGQRAGGVEEIEEKQHEDDRQEGKAADHREIEREGGTGHRRRRCDAAEFGKAGRPADQAEA